MPKYDTQEQFKAYISTESLSRPMNPFDNLSSQQLDIPISNYTTNIIVVCRVCQARVKLSSPLLGLVQRAVDALITTTANLPAATTTGYREPVVPPLREVAEITETRWHGVHQNPVTPCSRVKWAQ